MLSVTENLIYLHRIKDTQILIQSYYTVQVQRTSDSKNVKTGSLLHALFLETPSQ